MNVRVMNTNLICISAKNLCIKLMSNPNRCDIYDISDIDKETNN